MKKVIYVDYENVNLKGLDGIERLTDEDEVKIFIGAQTSKLSMKDADRIFNSDAHVELITNTYIGKNALDFIIMVHLGYDIAKELSKNYYIISKDKGYDPAIHEMRKVSGFTILRRQEINETFESKLGVGRRILNKIGIGKSAEEPDKTEHQVVKKHPGRKNAGAAAKYGTSATEKKSSTEELPKAADPAGDSDTNVTGGKSGNGSRKDYRKGGQKNDNRKNNKAGGDSQTNNGRNAETKSEAGRSGNSGGKTSGSKNNSDALSANSGKQNKNPGRKNSDLEKGGKNSGKKGPASENKENAGSKDAGYEKGSEKTAGKGTESGKNTGPPKGSSGSASKDKGSEKKNDVQSGKNSGKNRSGNQKKKNKNYRKNNGTTFVEKEMLDNDAPAALEPVQSKSLEEIKQQRHEMYKAAGAEKKADNAGSKTEESPAAMTAEEASKAAELKKMREEAYALLSSLDDD